MSSRAVVGWTLMGEFVMDSLGHHNQIRRISLRIPSDYFRICTYLHMLNWSVYTKSVNENGSEKKGTTHFMMIDLMVC